MRATNGKIQNGDRNSFEAIVMRGVSTTKVEDSNHTKINTRNCPEFIKSLLWFLKTKHQNLKSESAVTRYLSKTGIMEIEKFDDIKKLGPLRRKAILEGDLMERKKFLNHQFIFSHCIRCEKGKLSGSSFKWVAGKISDIGNDLGLDNATIFIMSLMVGLTKSEQWVPGKYQRMASKEITRFKRWIKKRVENVP